MAGKQQQNLEPVNEMDPSVFKQCALHCRPIATKITSVVGHVGWVVDMTLQENLSDGRRDTAEKVLCSTSMSFIVDQLRPNLQVLLTWGLSTRFEVSGKSLEWKKRYCQEGTLFFKWSALHNRLIATKITSLLGHGGWVLDIEFQKNPFTGRRNRVERYWILQVKCPSFRNEWDQTDTCRPSGLNAKYVVSGKFLPRNK